jgi:LysR family transcriptional regulator, transcription activator of glutamate synthase operon
MELRQLRAVVAVAHRLSFTAAADELSIAQPALSQQVAALERELGVRLFERTNRRVALTDAGRTFTGRAERVLADLASIGEEMTAFAGGLRGRVVLGTYQSFAEYRLPKLLGRFHAAHPGIEIALREGFANELLLGLRDGTIDVFIGHLLDASIAPEGFRSEALYEDELVIAAAPTHPLAARRSVAFAEMRDESWIIFRPGSSITNRLMHASREAGFSPRVVFESADSLTIRALVAEGLGVALYPRLLANMPGPNVSLVSLVPHEMRMISLVTREGPQAPAALRFISFIRESLE